jgi:hypothetical protein
MRCARIEIRARRPAGVYANTSVTRTMEMSKKLNTLIMMLPRFGYI